MILLEKYLSTESSGKSCVWDAKLIVSNDMKLLFIQSLLSALDPKEFSILKNLRFEFNTVKSCVLQ